jgi:hypothetical protein
VQEFDLSVFILSCYPKYRIQLVDSEISAQPLHNRVLPHFAPVAETWRLFSELGIFKAGNLGRGACQSGRVAFLVRGLAAIAFEHEFTKIYHAKMLLTYAFHGENLQMTESAASTPKSASLEHYMMLSGVPAIFSLPLGGCRLYFLWLIQ